MDWKEWDLEKPEIGQNVLVCGPLFKQPLIAHRMKEPEHLPHGLVSYFCDDWQCVVVNVKWWMPLPSVPNK